MVKKSYNDRSSDAIFNKSMIFLKKFLAKMYIKENRVNKETGD